MNFVESILSTLLIDPVAGPNLAYEPEYVTRWKRAFLVGKYAFASFSITGRRITVVREHGVLVAGVQFPAARPT